jgi:H+/Cl- antiporter ClcA
MNTDLVVAGAGLLGFLVGMTVLWLFWIAVWAEFWRRRINPKWQAEALGVVAGALFPLSVPVGAVAVGVLWLMNVMRRSTPRDERLPP